MSVRVYVPAPHRSVRPADLEPEQRDAVRAADPPARPRGRRSEGPALVALALVLAFLIKTFLLQAFYIPSRSMASTLETGDRVVVEKVTYRLRAPQRGEIIVFRRPGAPVEGAGSLADALRQFAEGLGLVPPDDGLELIKRVIGLPGEVVQVRSGAVFIEDRALDEPYLRPDASDYGPLTVPEGRYFVLGDNRANSDDSRFGLGTIAREDVVGRAFIVLWPPGRLAVSLDRDYPVVGELPSGAGAD